MPDRFPLISSDAMWGLNSRFLQVWRLLDSVRLLRHLVRRQVRSGGHPSILGMSKSASFCQLITQAQLGALCELLCLRLAVVLADDARQGAEDGQMEVSPVPGAALTWAGGHLLGVLYTTVSTETRNEKGVVQRGLLEHYFSPQPDGPQLVHQTPHARAMACAPQSNASEQPGDSPAVDQALGDETLWQQGRVALV